MAERPHWWIERWLRLRVSLSLFVSFCLSLSLALSLSLSLALCLCLSMNPSIHLSIWVSDCLPACLSVRPFVCLSLSLSLLEVLCLSRKIILANPKIWCSKMQLLSHCYETFMFSSFFYKAQNPLRLPRKITSYHILFSKSDPVFNTFDLRMFFIRHLNFQKLSILVETWCVFSILQSKCVSQATNGSTRVSNISIQKCSGTEVLWKIWTSKLGLRNVFFRHTGLLRERCERRALKVVTLKGVSRHRDTQFLISSGQLFSLFQYISIYVQSHQHPIFRPPTHIISFEETVFFAIVRFFRIFVRFVFFCFFFLSLSLLTVSLFWLFSPLLLFLSRNRTSLRNQI